MNIDEFLKTLGTSESDFSDTHDDVYLYLLGHEDYPFYIKDIKKDDNYYILNTEIIYTPQGDLLTLYVAKTFSGYILFDKGAIAKYLGLDSSFLQSQDWQELRIHFELDYEGDSFYYGFDDALGFVKGINKFSYFVYKLLSKDYGHKFIVESDEETSKYLDYFAIVFHSDGFIFNNVNSDNFLGSGDECFLYGSEVKRLYLNFKYPIFGLEVIAYYKDGSSKELNVDKLIYNDNIYATEAILLNFPLTGIKKLVINAFPSFQVILDEGSPLLERMAILYQYENEYLADKTPLDYVIVAFEEGDGLSNVSSLESEDGNVTKIEDNWFKVEKSNQPIHINPSLKNDVYYVHLSYLGTPYEERIEMHTAGKHVYAFIPGHLDKAKKVKIDIYDARFQKVGEPDFVIYNVKEYHRNIIDTFGDLMGALFADSTDNNDDFVSFDMPEGDVYIDVQYEIEEDTSFVRFELNELKYLMADPNIHPYLSVLTVDENRVNNGEKRIFINDEESFMFFKGPGLFVILDLIEKVNVTMIIKNNSGEEKEYRGSLTNFHEYVEYDERRDIDILKDLYEYTFDEIDLEDDVVISFRIDQI